MLRSVLFAAFLLIPAWATAQENSNVEVKKESPRSSGYNLSRDSEAVFRSNDGMFTLTGFPIWFHDGISVIKRSEDGKLIAIDHKSIWRRDAFRLANSKGVTKPNLAEYELRLKNDLDLAVLAAFKKRCKDLEDRVAELEKQLQSNDSRR